MWVVEYIEKWIVTASQSSIKINSLTLSGLAVDPWQTTAVTDKHAHVWKKGRDNDTWMNFFNLSV